MVKKGISSALLIFGMALSHSLYALEFECKAGDDNRFIRQELPGIEQNTKTSGALRASNGQITMAWINLANGIEPYSMQS